ncbi:TetR/AcrR family transcriptional regulator [Cryptosporangium sp. NPDC048952]|uniref:TetR/AcrR family transcriptional regulator n=1 Tax=Cryptosporangium sp. NPDC048952 TaxID=3363961 RepID=UPI00371EA72C
MTLNRRRGAALEAALLSAAWDELVEKGYDGFTIESVAERAQTSRAVVYRRWASKPELVRAAVERSAAPAMSEPPHTGSLRSDVITILQEANRRRATLAVVIAARLGTYFAETGSSIADLRATVMGDRSTVMGAVLDEAVERGEADPAKLTPRVTDVAFDLFRHELLMTYKPVPDDVIASIVDEVFLPLVRPSNENSGVTGGGNPADLSQPDARSEGLEPPTS